VIPFIVVLDHEGTRFESNSQHSYRIIRYSSCCS